MELPEDSQAPRLPNPPGEGPAAAPVTARSGRPRRTAPEDRVPRHEKALYGLGSPSLNMVNQIVEFQAQQVLVFGLGMSPAMNGLIIMIFRTWDAFTDPVMGWISDNTRGRYGRRRPYMFCGAFAMCALVPFVWRFDETWDVMLIAAWFTAFGMVLSTATTVFNIPYQTLKLEMTPDYNERISINVYSGVVIKLFAIGVSPWVWKLSQHPLFTGQLPGEEPNTLLGIRNLALWFAGVALLLALVPTFVCRERYYQRASRQKREPLVRSLGLTFRSRPFRLMLAFILTLNLEGLVTGMGGYITLYHLFDGNRVFAATYTGVAGMIGGALGLVSIPVFGWLGGRFGKERALILVTAIDLLMGVAILFFYNPDFLRWLAMLPATLGIAGADWKFDHRWLAIVPQVMNGVLVAALWTIVPSMKADIVDEDESRTGERREGSFESIFSWFLRLTGTLFMGLSGLVVVGLGFEISQASSQADGVFQRMVFAMGIVPMVLGSVQAWLIWKWPLTAARMEEIRDQLEATRGRIDMSGGPAAAALDGA